MARFINVMCLYTVEGKVLNANGSLLDHNSNFYNWVTQKSIKSKHSLEVSHHSPYITQSKM